VVLDRFSNPHLRDTNQRVAMDGFAKIPGFLWPTLRERLALNVSIAKSAKLPALFFEFLGRWHQGGLAYTYQDQGMEAASVHALFEAPDPLGAFCRDPLLWGPLAGNEQLSGAITAAHREVRAFAQEPDRLPERDRDER
jgi:D-arabinitol 4-dehydrogenase